MIDDSEAEAMAAAEAEANYHAEQEAMANEAAQGEYLKSLGLYWRKYPEEKPEGKKVVCLVAGEHLAFPVVWTWMGEGWAINLTAEILGSHKAIQRWLPLKALEQLPDNRIE